MATLLTTREILNETLRLFENELAFTSTITKRYDDRFARAGAKRGDSISVRLPVQFEVYDGEVYVPQQIVERDVPIVLDRRKHVGFDYQNIDLTLSMDQFAERYLASPVSRLANVMDSDGLTVAYQNVANTVGTPGVAISTEDPFLEAGVVLDDEAVPRARRVAVLSSRMHMGLNLAVKGQFNPQATIGDVQTNGLFARKFLGIDRWHMDQNVQRHTVGALGTAGTPTSAFLMDEVHVQAADTADTSTIHIDGADSGTAILKKGDVLQITDVNGVNPVSGQSYGRRRDFVVQADVTAVGVDADVVVAPAIRATGPYKTVDALPANNAPIFVFAKGTANYGDIDGVQSPQGLIYHPEFMALAMADLAMESDGSGAMQERISSKKSGISILMTKQFEARTMTTICRLDILYGWKVLRREMAVRVAA